MSVKQLSMMPNAAPAPQANPAQAAGGGGKRSTSHSHAHGQGHGGGAGTSLNHLLNFSLPPREPVVQHRPRRARRVESTAVWNKERFVNAQHHFVLRPNGDYAVHFADPDIFFQWTDILQVIIPPPSTVSHSSTSSSAAPGAGLQCPICLEQPVAPRMTKCGHVYCYPCILHYLETADARKWARCPICFDSIYEKALKPVLFLPSNPSPSSAFPHTSTLSSSSTSASTTAPSTTVIPTSTSTDNTGATNPNPASPTSPASGAGEELGPGTVRLRLMLKPPHTTLVLPRSASWPGLVKPLEVPFLFMPDVMRFSRFMLPTPSHLHTSAQSDLQALQRELSSLLAINDDLGASFVRRAMDRVREWEEQVEELELEEGARREREKAERELEGWVGRERRKERERLREREKGERDVASGAPLPEAPAEFLAQSSSLPPTPTANPPSVPGQAQREGPGGATAGGRHGAPLPPPTYYYYQAANGAAVFLHPLDIRILRAVFGGYERFPGEILVGVEASEEGRVTPQLRKTHKYLSHLPEGQDITFLEADLSVLCTPQQLAPFADLLHKRRERRREREEREERARKKAQREMEIKEAREAAVVAGRRPASMGMGWGRNGGRVARSEWEVEGDWSASASDEHDHEHDQAGTSPSVSALGTSLNSHPGGGAAPSTSPSGAWGNRTFASAALSNSTPRPRPPPRSRPSRTAYYLGDADIDPGEEEQAWEREYEREREMDVAWLELESRALEERALRSSAGSRGGGGGGQGGGGVGGEGAGGGKGGKRKKGQKLVLLGGSGRGRT